MILQTAECAALAETLHRVKAFLVIDALSPAEHAFEITKRDAFRKDLVERIEAAIRLVGRLDKAGGAS